MDEDLEYENLEIPKFLYRYMPGVGATDFAEKNITDLLQGKIRLTGKAEINDPFDLNPSVQFNISPSELYVYMKKVYLGNNLPSKLTGVHRALRQEFSSLYQLKKATPKRYHNLKKYWFENTKPYNSTAFSSWSANKGHALMWSHYASNHSGVCIEMEAGYQLVNCPYIFLPIQYGERRPIYEFSFDSFYSTENKKRNLGILYKSMDWKYENEWRLFGIHGGTAKDTHKVGDILDIDPSLFTRVIIGHKASENTIHAVKRAIANSPASPHIVSSKISENDYSIDG